jgi:hypothetical protein
MADVDMTDSPAPAAAKTKVSKSGGSGDVSDGKKRFEVKKVFRTSGKAICCCKIDVISVERRGSVGMGHRR